jgi:hypothetical protein
LFKVVIAGTEAGFLHCLAQKNARLLMLVLGMLSYWLALSQSDK